MPRFPIEYDVTLHKGSSVPFEVKAGSRTVLSSGPPAEFGGSEMWWSPEHLLVSAVTTCFAATYFAAAQRVNLPLGQYLCRAKGTLDKTPEGVAFTEIHLALELHVLSDDKERARKLVEDVKRHCFVAKSLRCPVDVSVDIVAS